VKQLEAQQLATILANGPLVVDGAMATELQKKGVDTANNLWSATALLNAPSAIKEVHRSYFVAGANIVLTNSYQANLPAFEAHGFSEEEGQHLIQKAVQLAQAARDEYVQTLPADKKRPLLIAGSVGPYGAYLANGSEYTGDYLLRKEEYKNFHRPRMQALAQAGVDLFAFETQPNFAETQALAELLYEEFPEMLAWLSFSVDGKDKLCDGTPLKQAVSYFVDDEHSEDLFLGYTVAANRLKGQLKEKNILVDADHPLFVYLPCGIGGSPGGITFGLKQIYGDNVHCFFAEPTHVPSMLVGLLTGEYDGVTVKDFGLDGLTVADGLAVPRTSGFVAKVLEDFFSGSYTVDDHQIYELLSTLIDQEEIYLEPAALAGVPGSVRLFQSTAGKKYLQDHHLSDKMNQATHIAWATGGSMVPEEDRHVFYAQGQQPLNA